MSLTTPPPLAAPSPASAAVSDRVPLAQKVVYGIGGMPENMANSLAQQMINPVYNIGLGISPATLGVILMVYRIWDSLTDVVMGNLSDNARTRWGRRRPFIVAGGILTGLTFPLLWQARADWSQPMIIAYAVVSGLVFYSAFTVWSMPYYSLGMEMTPDYDERTRIVAHRAFFSKFTGLVSGWLMALITLPVFAGAGSDGEPDIAAGMRSAGWLVGLAIMAVAVLPGFFVPERFYEKRARAQPKVGLMKSVRDTLSCRPYVLLIAIVVLQCLGYGIVGAMGLYLNIYYVHRGDMQAASILEGLKSTACFLPGLLSVPLWTWASGRFGKTATLAATLLIGMVANAAMFVCYTPEQPYLQILPSLLMSAFGYGIWMIAPSMQADVVDHDEFHSGERREGSFSAVFSWALKFSGSLTAGLSGVILVWSGFDLEKYGSQQPEEVMRAMLAWYSFVPLVFCGLALGLLGFYRLDRERMHEIRAALEQRRGKI